MRRISLPAAAPQRPSGKRISTVIRSGGPIPEEATLPGAEEESKAGWVVVGIATVCVVALVVLVLSSMPAQPAKPEFTPLPPEPDVRVIEEKELPAQPGLSEEGTTGESRPLAPPLATDISTPVIEAYNFQNAEDAERFTGGHIVSGAYGESRGAYASDPGSGGEQNAVAATLHGAPGRALISIDDTTHLALAYRLTGAEDLIITVRKEGKEYPSEQGVPKPDDWNTLQVELAGIVPEIRSGDILETISFGAGRPGREGVSLVVDNVMLLSRRFSLREFASAMKGPDPVLLMCDFENEREARLFTRGKLIGGGYEDSPRACAAVPAGLVTLGGNVGRSSIKMYVVAVRGHSSGALVITGTSPAAYEWDKLEDGNKVYTDRGYTYADVPRAYAGLRCLRTANDDKKSKGRSFVTFTVNQEVTVYVGFDDRIAPKPSWLNAFTDTGDDLAVSGDRLSLFKRQFLGVGRKQGVVVAELVLPSRIEVELTKDLHVAFAYKLSGTDKVWVSFRSHAAEDFGDKGFAAPELGEWQVLQVCVADFAERLVGERVDTVTFRAGRPGQENASLVLDNVMLLSRHFSEKELVGRMAPKPSEGKPAIPAVTAPERVEAGEPEEVRRLRTEPAKPEGPGIRVGVVADGHGSGSLFALLKTEPGLCVFRVHNFLPGTMKVCQVLVLPQQKKPDVLTPEVTKRLVDYVEQGGRLLVTHDAVGIRSHPSLFTPVCKRGTEVTNGRKCTVVAKHPITRGIKVGSTFEHSYYDHIVLEPGEKGKVLIADGKRPVVVVGESDEGRFIAWGMVTGINDSGGAEAPAGMERDLFVKAVRWLAEGLKAPASGVLGLCYEGAPASGKAGSDPLADPTTAKVLAQFDDGLPAIAINELGAGRVLLLNWHADSWCPPAVTDFTKRFLDSCGLNEGDQLLVLDSDVNATKYPRFFGQGKKFAEAMGYKVKKVSDEGLGKLREKDVVILPRFYMMTDEISRALLERVKAGSSAVFMDGPVYALEKSAAARELLGFRRRGDHFNREVTLSSTAPVAEQARAEEPEATGVSILTDAVVLKFDFEKKDEARLFSGGRYITKGTHARSQGAYKSVPNLSDNRNSVVITLKPPIGSEALFTVEDGMHIAFAYRLSGGDSIHVATYIAGRREYLGRTRSAKSGDGWHVVQVAVTGIVDLTKRASPKVDDEVAKVAIRAGSAHTVDAVLTIDNVMVLSRKLPEDQLLALMTGTPVAAGASVKAPPGAEKAPPAGKKPKEVPAASKAVAVIEMFDFERPEDEKRFQYGRLVRTGGHGGSKSAYAASEDMENKYSSRHITLRSPKGSDRLAIVRSNLHVVFAYKFKGPKVTGIYLGTDIDGKGHRGASVYPKKEDKDKEWHIAQVRIVDMTGSGKKHPEVGEVMRNFAISAGKAELKGVMLVIDNVMLINGRFPDDQLEAALIGKVSLARWLNAEPETDGYLLTIEMASNLSSHYKPGAVKPKTVAVLGSGVATAREFLGPLTQGGRSLAGEDYALLPRPTFTARRRKFGEFRKKSRGTSMVRSGLERHKPEVVLVMAGQDDIGKTASFEMETALNYIADAVLRSGAVPVMCTLPIIPARRGHREGDILAINERIARSAAAMKVPLLDAYAIISSEEKRAFTSSGWPKPETWAKVNRRFEILYRVIEAAVFDRTDRLPPGNQ